jgi:predicted phosphodiesterase
MNKKLQVMLDNLSVGEQQALLRGLSSGQRVERRFNHVWSGNRVKFGYYSDPHVGEKHFSEALWLRMISYFKRQKIERVYCPGDNLEGMSGRPGHIYELTHIGATAQLDYASQLFAAGDNLQFFITDGNHDLWYKNKNNSGLLPGAELQHRNKNVTYLGEWEAVVTLGNGVDMLLFHANDGTAYADSYKIQKLIDSLEDNNRPQIILSGHYHKQVEVFRRNVFGFECGTLCGQTRWMRGKKIQAHKGFGIIEIWVSARGGIERLRHEFIPDYD